MPIADIFLHSFYIVVSYLENGIVLWPRPCQPRAEIRDRLKERIYFFRDYYVFRTKNRQNWDRFKVKIFFLQITMFLGREIDKIGTNSKLQIFSFIIRSNVVSVKCCFGQVSFRSSVVSIKCRFDQVSFNQMSFRSSVALIKCRSIKCRSIKCRSINCRSTVLIEVSPLPPVTASKAGYAVLKTAFLRDRSWLPSYLTSIRTIFLP